jgi:hypothetical protein
MSAYNGWKNWATWNVALWILSDEGLYDAAKDCKTYGQLALQLWECGSKKTPDGACWYDPSLDTVALSAMMTEL